MSTPIDKWTPKDIPDLSGKVAIVTGANIGLGLEITKQLALHDATVILGCRTPSKAEKAIEEIGEELSEEQKARCKVMQVDVSSFDSVKEFCDAYEILYDRLDILMCNAGIMAIEEKKLSKDGYELQFATNHLGHFLLCGKLLPLLKNTQGSRIVTQSSAANWTGSFDFDDLNCEKNYSRWNQYSMTKLSNVAFANQFNILNKDHANPTAFSVHPGLVIGQLQQVQAGNNILYKWAYGLFGVFAGTYETGARPALYACTAPEAKQGEFYGPDGLMNGSFRGNHPKVVEPNKIAADKESIEKLWKVSEELTNFKYDF